MSCAALLGAESAFSATYFSRATGNWNAAATWSTAACAGAAAASAPAAADNVQICNLAAAHTVTVTANATAASVTMNGGNQAATLTINGGILLTVNGDLVVNAPTTGNDKTVQLAANGDLVVGGDLVLVGGAAAGQLARLILASNAGTTVTIAGSLAGALGGGAFNAQAQVTFSGAGSLTIGGDFADGATFARGTGTVTFDGAGAQNVGGYTYRNLSVNKPSGAATLTAAAALNGGNLTVGPSGGGTLDLGAFAIDRTAAGGTLTVANGATLKIGGTNGFPANYTTHALGATSTIEFAGGNQLVAVEAAPGYGNLTLSGGSTKTSLGAQTVRGALTIAAGTAFADGGGIISVNGNVANDGTHSGAGSIRLTGGSAAHQLSGNGTYQNLQLNDANGAALTGSPTVAGTLTLTTGTFAVAGNTLTLNGPTIAGTPTNLSTTTASSLVFGGASVGVNLPSSVTQLNNLTGNNSNGLTLNSSPTIGGTLTLTSGVIATGLANTLITSADCTAPSVVRTTGRVFGNLQKTFPTGSPSCDFEIGDATNYTPITSLGIGSVSVAGMLTARVDTPDHTDTTAGTSGINATKDVNRYWTVTAGGGLTFIGAYGATFNFVAADIDAGPPVPNTGNFVVAKKDGGYWIHTTVSSPTGISIQATALTQAQGFGVFAVGEVTTINFTREKEFVYTRERY